MKAQSGLEEIFLNAWQIDIKSCCVDQMISSERHLQAELFMALHKRLSKEGYEIFVESKEFEDPETGKGMVPDLIIAKGREIVAFFELKYQIGNYLEYTKDEIKLIKYKQINFNKPVYLRSHLKINKFNEEISYLVTHDTLLVFAGLGIEGSSAFDKSKWSSKDEIFVLYGYWSVKLNEFVFGKL